MKKQTLSEIIFQKMIKSEPFKETLREAIQNKQFVDSGMKEVWAGILRFDDTETFNELIDNHIYPNEKSEIVHQIFFHYDCFKKRRETLKEQMDFVVSILEKTPQGQQSIVKDIEKYFQYYGKVKVSSSSYDFIEPIYQKYAKENDKIYYLEIVNQLKFFNTFSVPLSDLSVIEDKTLPILDKIVHTNYFNKVKNIKFTMSENQEYWVNFCKKYQSQAIMEKKYPPTGNNIKKIKI